MKKIIPLLIMALTCSTACINAGTPHKHPQTARLTQQERDKIWHEIHACVHFSENHLRKAHAAANRITDCEIREMIKNAIQGALFGFATSGNGYFALMTGASLVVEEIVRSRVKYADRVLKEIKIAQRFATKADRLQEKLWRDQ